MISRLLLTIAFHVLTKLSLFAQDPARALDDLDFCNHCPHLVAHVEIGNDPKNLLEKFQYDRYSNVVRVKLDGQAYVKKAGGKWLKSSDWGDTGDPVDSNTSDHLDFCAEAPELTFKKRTSSDPTQGGFVWKLIEQHKEDPATIYTFELSREHPKAGGFYPQYTFSQWPDDKEGQLFLTKFETNLKNTSGTVFMIIYFDYCFPLPEGVVISYPTHPGVKPTHDGELNLYALKQLKFQKPPSTEKSSTL